MNASFLCVHSLTMGKQRERERDGCSVCVYVFVSWENGRHFLQILRLGASSMHRLCMLDSKFVQFIKVPWQGGSPTMLVQFLKKKTTNMSKLYMTKFGCSHTY